MEKNKKFDDIIIEILLGALLISLNNFNDGETIVVLKEDYERKIK